MALGRALIVSTMLVLTGLTSSCYRGARVEVTELSDGRISIEVLPTGVLNDRMCVGTIAIHEGSAGGSVVWALRRSDDGDVCRSEFTFPEVPPGYELDAPNGIAGSLSAGRDYWIQVSGPDGLFNGRAFTHERDSQHD